MTMVMVMVFIYSIFYMYIFKCGLQPMNHEIAQRPDQHTGNSTPYVFDGHLAGEV